MATQDLSAFSQGARSWFELPMKTLWELTSLGSTCKARAPKLAPGAEERVWPPLKSWEALHDAKTNMRSSLHRYLGAAKKRAEAAREQQHVAAEI